MNHIKKFEHFNNIILNEEVKMFGKEVKLWPSYNDTLKKNLNFLNDYDLDNYTVGGNQKEIKDLMIKIDKKTKTERNSLKKNIENANMKEITSMYNVLKSIKTDLNDDNKIIGYISYFPDLNKFVYNKGFEFNR